MSRPSTCPMNRHGGGHSMVSTAAFTQGTTSTSAITNTSTEFNPDTEEGSELINNNGKKKKKSLFKNFFHFGSRKTRSKSVSMDSNRYRREDSINNESSNSGEVFHNSSQFSPEFENRKYQIEEEYRKEKEAEKNRTQNSPNVPAGCYSFGRSNLSVPRPSTHQSMPASQRSKISPVKYNSNKTNDVNFNSTVMSPRDTVGVPVTMMQTSKSDSKFVYGRTNRIFPEQTVGQHSPAMYASFNENKPTKVKFRLFCYL